MLAQLSLLSQLVYSGTLKSHIRRVSLVFQYVQGESRGSLDRVSPSLARHTVHLFPFCSPNTHSAAHIRLAAEPILPQQASLIVKPLPPVSPALGRCEPPNEVCCVPGQHSGHTAPHSVPQGAPTVSSTARIWPAWAGVVLSFSTATKV